MDENNASGQYPVKARGRPLGSPNKITRDIRATLRDLADGNAHRVQDWLNQVAEKDPAEALRLFLGLLRYVTPTLQAAAIADITPKSPRDHLSNMTDDELLRQLIDSPEAKTIARTGVQTMDALFVRVIDAETSPEIADGLPEDELLR